MAGLWREFEDRSSPEGRFARAVDALAPTWLHWGEHANPTPAPLTATRIMERKTEFVAPYPRFSGFWRAWSIRRWIAALIGP